MWNDLRTYEKIICFVSCIMFFLLFSVTLMGERLFRELSHALMVVIYGLIILVSIGAFLYGVIWFYFNLADRYFGIQKKYSGVTPRTPDTIPTPNFSNVTPSPSLATGAALPVFDVLHGIERSVICGGTRAGKSFTAKRFCEHLLRRGDIVYVLDIKHRTRDDYWPDKCQVFGSGGNYVEIEHAFDLIDAEKEKRGRFLDMISGFPFVHVFFDEVNNCLHEMPDLAERYVKILRVYGQYKIGIHVIGQSTRAESIGLKGKYDLMSCFDCITELRHDKRTGERKAIIDFQDGQKPLVCLPPPPEISAQTHQTPPETSHSAPQKESLEENVLRRYQNGDGITAIATDIFGNKSGRNNKKIKAILADFGLNV